MMKAIRELLEAIAPAGTRQQVETPAVEPLPEPAGNVPVRKRKQALWIGVGLLVLLTYLSFHPSQPVSPVSQHNRAARPQTTTLTPAEVTQSGQTLQNDTNQVVAHDQARNLAADQFNSDPANTGLVDPNREAKLRAENIEPSGAQQQAYATGAGTNVDPRKEREALLQKSLHSSPYVAPTQMTAYQRPNMATETRPASMDAPALSGRHTADEQANDTEDSPDWNQYEGGLHRILAGTVLRGVLKNRIEGSYSGPAVIQITDDVYTHNRSALVMKAGTILMGTAKSVNSQWQSRISLVTNRVIMPDGFSQSLQDLPGLSQRGEMGLSDKVDRHYGQIFGSALVIGAIGAVGQIGNSTSGFGYDPSVAIRNGVTQSMGQTSERLLDKFSNRPPTLTIREGTRVSLILADDVLLPEYAKHLVDSNL